MSVGDNDIEYSSRYSDDYFEYRHVVIPKSLVPRIPHRLLSESEWRAIGIRQSRGWENYMRYEPEPHILLFRRSKFTDAINGRTDFNGQTTRTAI